MAIELVTKFQPYVDELFKNESKRDLLTNQDFSWTGAHTIKVYKVSTSAMNDYDRARTGSNWSRYTAARRGHQVVLCEKENELGGILKSEQALPFKYEMYQLTGTYEKLARDAGVEIRLSTEVTKEYAEKENADALIIAEGSEPLVPPIPGLDGDNVVVVNNYYREKDKVGSEVVVMGGGLAGCECAIHLAQEGKTVRLVEMRYELAPDANVRHRPLMLKQMAELGDKLTICTSHKALKVTTGGVICQDQGGKEVLIPGGSVICALGQRSRRTVVDALRDAAPFVRVIGDAAKVSTITNAVYWGYEGGTGPKNRRK